MEVSPTTRSGKAAAIPPCYWTNADVLQWMKNAQPDLFHKYGGFFKSHGIQDLNERVFLPGRTLFMLNDNFLLEMGIQDAQDRVAFRIEIAKLKLKSDLLTLKNSHYKGNIRFVEENPIDESLQDETF